MTAPAVIDAPAQLLTGGRVVTPGGVLDDAWVRVAGDTIVSIETSPPPIDAPVVDLAGAWLLPGYVDLHMHGGGGHSVASSLEAMDAAVAFHRLARAGRGGADRARARAADADLANNRAAGSR